MSANTIITSVLTAGTNNHTTSSEEVNALRTDFGTAGVIGAITLNSGSGGTGSFCVNQNTGSNMAINILAGTAQFAVTPSSQNSQMLRAYASADYTAYTINSNSSGSTKYDWIYLKGDATNANTPSSTGDNVVSIFTSRSSSNSTDNGTPPTYGLLLAIVTVANGAAAITNSNITDKRYNASLGAQNGSLIVNQNGTGTNAKVQAAGIDANVALELDAKGTSGVVVPSGGLTVTAGGLTVTAGTVTGIVNHLVNPYKFNVYRSAATTSSSSSTIIPFDTVLFDTGSNFSTSTHKFTAPVAGFYYFSAGAGNTVATSGQIVISFIKNSGSTPVTLANSALVLGSVNTGTVIPVSGLYQLAVNDTVEVQYIGGSGSTMAGGQNNLYFSGFLVSAT